MHSVVETLSQRAYPQTVQPKVESQRTQKEKKELDKFNLAIATVLCGKVPIRRSNKFRTDHSPTQR